MLRSAFNHRPSHPRFPAAQKLMSDWASYSSAVEAFPGRFFSAAHP